MMIAGVPGRAADRQPALDPADEDGRDLVSVTATRSASATSFAESTTARHRAPLRGAAWVLALGEFFRIDPTLSLERTGVTNPRVRTKQTRATRTGVNTIGSGILAPWLNGG